MDRAFDYAITGLCVVTDPSKAPPNFTVIDRTYDRSEDSDLWKDGFFGRRTMRYLCVENAFPCYNRDVLIDVVFINEKDSPPPGFTVVENTYDTGEKALKRRLLCCRWTLPKMTLYAIAELIFLSRSSRKLPAGFTLVGETNGMSLCYKRMIISLPSNGRQPGMVSLQGYPTQPAQHFAMSGVRSSLPYLTSTLNGATSSTRSDSNISYAHTVNAPISGIPWQLNSCFHALGNIQKFNIPYKSVIDIEKEYHYDFLVERQAASSMEVREA